MHHIFSDYGTAYNFITNTTVFQYFSGNFSEINLMKGTTIMNIKKLTAAAAAVCIAAGAVSFGVSADYTDVKESDWFYPAVSEATANKLFSGYEDGSFKPSASITRAEAAKVLVTYAHGSLLPDAPDNLYSDIEGGEWYAPFVAVSGSEDIIPAGKEFDPLTPITREDTVVGMMKVLNITPTDSDLSEADKFTDKKDISDYALKSVAAASAKGIINGYEDGSFGAKLPVTRAEFAQIFMNAGKLGQEEPTLTPSPTAAPSATAEPTAAPTATPTADPKATPTPSPSPVPITEDFKDKTIFVYGDLSLQQNLKWVQMVKDNLAPESMTSKYSYGTTYANYGTNTFTNAVSSFPEDMDYLLIMGGRYDWEVSRPIGDPTSVLESDFTGGLRAFIERVKVQHPDTKLIIMTIPNISNAKTGFTEGGVYNTAGMSAEDYSLRMKEICAEKKIDVIDLNTECWAQNELSTYLKYENMAYLIANDSGTEKIADVITSRLIEINAE